MNRKYNNLYVPFFKAMFKVKITSLNNVLDRMRRKVFFPAKIVKSRLLKWQKRAPVVWLPAFLPSRFYTSNTT